MESERLYACAIARCAQGFCGGKLGSFRPWDFWVVFSLFRISEGITAVQVLLRYYNFYRNLTNFTSNLVQKIRNVSLKLYFYYTNV